MSTTNSLHMHTCLRIAELQNLIIHHVDAKSTLASLARVNKLFKESALDALYSHIDCFPDLLRCLPSDLWTIVPSHGLQNADERYTMKRSIVFTRPMSREDWGILQSYANRVVSMQATFYDWPCKVELAPSFETCVALSQCPVSTLFPKLRALYVLTVAEPHFLLLGSIFLSPQIRYLEAEPIDIFTGRPRAEPSLAVSKAICSCQNLRSVSCGSADVSMLIHLSQLSLLRSLSIYTTQTSQWLTSTRFSPFKHLQKLTLVADRGSTNVQALEHLLSGTGTSASSQRTDILIVKCIVLEESSLFAFTSALQRCCSHALVHIEMTFTERWVSDADDNIGSFSYFDALRPLTSFHNLKFLWISLVHFAANLSREQLCELASCWPSLEVMDIHPFDYPISFQTLLQLLQLLPAAHTIAIPTLIMQEDLRALMQPLPRFERITTLRFGLEDVDGWDVDALVLLLSRLVPCLSHISPLFMFEGLDIGDVHKSPSTTHEVLKRLHAMRRKTGFP